MKVNLAELTDSKLLELYYRLLDFMDITEELDVMGHNCCMVTTLAASEIQSFTKEINKRHLEV